MGPPYSFCRQEATWGYGNSLVANGQWTLQIADALLGFRKTFDGVRRYRLQIRDVMLQRGEIAASHFTFLLLAAQGRLRSGLRLARCRVGLAHLLLQCSESPDRGPLSALAVVGSAAAEQKLHPSSRQAASKPELRNCSCGQISASGFESLFVRKRWSQSVPTALKPVVVSFYLSLLKPKWADQSQRGPESCRINT